MLMINVSGFQTVLRDTLVFCENVPGVPREIPKNAKRPVFWRTKGQAEILS
jgi:hypothetical protein